MIMRDFVNTVPAGEQMKNATSVSFLGEADAPFKILVLGNSITRHGPKQELGWLGDHGMAASAPEKDYVHLLYGMLTESGHAVRMYVRQAAEWERSFLAEDALSSFASEKAFEADLIVFRLGENVPKENVPFFGEAILRFVRYLCPVGGRVVITTDFWDHKDKNAILCAAAQELGASLADITARDDSMMAYGLFSHRGVAGHPGDKGMRMIAEKIFAEIESILEKGKEK